MARNPPLGRWVLVGNKGDSPSPRHVHTAVTFKDSMYIFGGYNSNTLPCGDCHRFQFKTERWIPLTETFNWPVRYSSDNKPAIQRHSAVAVVNNENIYVFGGSGLNVKMNDILIINPETGLTTIWDSGEVEPHAPAPQNPPTISNRPAPRWGHTTVSYQNKLYVFGGMGSTILRDLYIFDITTKQWQSSKTLFPGKSRHYHSAVLWQPKSGSDDDVGMIIAGGWTNENLKDVWFYRFASDSWHRLANLPYAVRGHSAVMYGDSMYIFGGNARSLTSVLVEYDLSPEANGHPVSSIFRLSLSGTYGKASVIDKDYGDDPEYPSPRYFHSAVVYEDSMYIWGGMQKISGNSNSIYRYRFKPDPVRKQSSSLFCNPLFSDITFVVKDQKFPAHKAILYMKSDHFRALITSGMRESEMSEITISEIEPAIFSTVLEHLYSNTSGADTEVFVSPDNAMDLLIAADRYLLFDLKSACERVLCRVITEDMASNLMTFAAHYNAPLLHQRCQTLEREYTARVSSRSCSNDRLREQIENSQI